jgi:hypothetical protein
MLSSPASRHFLPLRSKHAPSTLFSNTLNRCSSLSVTDKVTRPYKVTGKIMVLYVSVLKFLERRREDKRFWTEW